jgi:ammonia channel protein AmtB
MAISRTIAIMASSGDFEGFRFGLQVSEEEEVQGLDLSQHGEEGYDWEASA